MNVYVHNLSPFAIQFTETFGIRWYGLSYLLGFFVTYLIAKNFVKRGWLPLAPQTIGDLIFTLALGTVIGGRVGYCLFYSPDLFTRFTSTFPFWGVLAINEGGMASHGGIVGIIIACFYFARKNNLNMLFLTDVAALGGTVGIFFGRIANFVNGELVGRPCSILHSWCVKFPQDIFLWTTKEPERIASLVPVAKSIGISESTWLELSKNFLLSQTSWSSVNITLGKIVAAIQYGDSMIANTIAPLLDARHPSQLYEALLEGAFLFLILMYAAQKTKTPGIVTALFLTLYPCVRIFGEQFRMPDPQIGFQWLGLTRGQWLSVGMLVVGLGFLMKQIKARYRGTLN